VSLRPLPVPYFDHNATAPLHPAARAAWLEAADRFWANPSSLYAKATSARDLLADCRERLADLLGCSDPSRIVFTAGATAANNVLARYLSPSAPPDAIALLSPLEHTAVDTSIRAAFPGRVSEIGVDADGVVTPESLAHALDDHGGRAIAAVSVMSASNESGVIQPWPELASLCRDRHIPFHTDAAQWLGKLPAAGLAVCDWVTGSGHKFGGPRGIGFLVVPAHARFRGDLGGPQEQGQHAGTENLPGIAGMIGALEAREQELPAIAKQGAAHRDAAIELFRKLLPAARVVSGNAERLWNTLAILISGADSRKLVAALDRAGIEASTGSACSSGAASAARVVAAIAPSLGLAPGTPAGMVRFSAGPDTTAADWQAAMHALAEAVIANAGPARPPRVDLR
jgi:cysteine desulfurase